MADEMPAKPIYTVLLVDDNEIVLRALHSYLERKGFNLLEARDGEEALLIAECYPSMIHVLVTDLMMAPMNGRELVQRLLPLRPETQMIMMSGYPDEILTQGELTRMIPILQKPFLPKELLTTIEEVLARPESQRTVASLAARPTPVVSQQAHVSRM
jgi:two-component system cell cycle sensor histidine kinase/response regulator CckA